MKFVNLKPKTVHTKFTGFIQPGKIIEGNRSSQRFAQILQEVVGSCGHMIGLILSPVEAELMDKILKLNKAGSEFNPADIPESLRKDPTGSDKALQRAIDAQADEISRDKERNRKSMEREAFINGEIEDPEKRARRPVGLNTLEGEQVDQSKLKSGFEKIMEENRRIAEGKKPESKDPEEILDPIGKHLKQPGSENPAPADVKPEGAQPPPIKRAVNRDDDGTRSADATEPTPQVSERAGAMDKAAAETARSLSIFSAFADVKTNAPDQKQSEPQAQGEGSDGSDRPAKKPKAKTKKGKAK